MPRILKSFSLLLILVGAVLQMAACGSGDDQEKAPAPATTHRMVPASVDSASEAAQALADTVAGSMVESTVESTVESMNGSSAGATTEESAPEVEEIPDSGRTSAHRTPPPPPARLMVQEPAGDYSLQVGSFRDQANARARADKLRELGHQASVEPALVKGQQYHRVFVRGLSSRSEAEKLGEDLRARLGMDYLVLRR